MSKMSKQSKKVAPAHGVDLASNVAKTTTPVHFSKQIAELQKKSLDMAAAQNAEWNSLWRKVVSRFEAGVAKASVEAADAASQTYQTAIKTHKTAIDLAGKKRPGLAVSGRSGTNAYSKYSGSLSQVLKTSLEQSLQAQKRMQELTAARNKAFLEAQQKIQLKKA